jgi:hypothetical protein
MVKSAQFRCKNLNRVVLLRASTINGIDYLEVLDRRAEALGSPPQRTLLVRMVHPAGALTAANVVIEGGVRTTGIGVEWAFAADSVPLGPATQDEIDFFAALPEPQNVLVVRTSAAGDFSIYRLRLVGAAGLDPILSSIDFDFKVECPSDFDCEKVEVCNPSAESGPEIDYLARDYATFRRLILDRYSTVMPEWRERNTADANIALIEVLAYAADRLAYYQDAVATEAYLGTARKRLSVRRHARLLDYFVHEGTNARVFVCVEPVSDGVTLHRKNSDDTTSAFFTEVDRRTRVDPPELKELLQTERSLVFEPMHDARFYSAHTKIRFYTWGDDSCCLPQGATRATLIDDPANRLRLMPGDVLILEEVLGRDTGLAPDADPSRRQAVRLISVSPSASTLVSDAAAERTPGAPATDPLTGAGIVEIEWNAEDALRFPLCISKELGGLPVADLSVARGNVVLADHGYTIPEAEALAAFGGDPRRYRPRLTRPEVTHTCQLDQGAAVSAAAMLHQDPREALAAVSLAPEESWAVRRDLLRSDRFANDFVVEPAEGGYFTLRFGDGVLGKRPEPNLSAIYRVGRGRAGNVGAESIAHVAAPTGTDIVSVRNPLPASGGLEPETLEEVKQYAPEAFRAQKRAVTEADYAAAAEEIPEVQKAVARRVWTGSWYTVYITVDRAGGRPIDQRFRDRVLGELEQVRLAGEDLELESPEMAPLEIKLVVCAKPNYRSDEVKLALLETFSAGVMRDGTPGFFHPDNFTFGQPLFLSALIERAMSVAGVDWVDSNGGEMVFERLGTNTTAESLQNGFIAVERLQIIQLDNSPSAPENGKLDVVVRGGI